MSSNPDNPDAPPAPTGAAADAGVISVDAAVLAAALQLPAADILQRIRSRQISAVHESGIGEDAGRQRVTFYHRNRRVRLLLDARGQILECAVERVRRAPAKA